MFAFIQAKLQNKTVDSLSQPKSLNLEQIIHTEKIYRTKNDFQNQKNKNQDCEESILMQTTGTMNLDKTSQKRVEQYKKMIIELKDEKHKLELKRQSTEEIDRKIEKLKTLILNLSK